MSQGFNVKVQQCPSSFDHVPSLVATCDGFAGRSEHLFVGGENVPSIRWKEVLCHQLDTA